MRPIIFYMVFLILFLIGQYSYSNEQPYTLDQSLQGLSLGSPFPSTPPSYPPFYDNNTSESEEIKRIEQNIHELGNQLREKMLECRNDSKACYGEDIRSLRRKLRSEKRYLAEEREWLRKRKRLTSQKDLAFHDLNVQRRRKERECFKMSGGSDSLIRCNNELAEITRQIEQLEGAELLKQLRQYQ